MSTFPIAIIEDRYGGTYSHGPWLAVACADTPIDGSRSESRAQFILNEGPNGGDTDAMTFWFAPPDWIAVGHTPDEARAFLVARSGARLREIGGDESEGQKA